MTVVPHRMAAVTAIAAAFMAPSSLAFNGTPLPSSSSSSSSSVKTLSALNAEGRRSFLSAGVAAVVASVSSSPAFAVQEKETRQGIEVNAFNGLAFNYRGSNFPGIKAEDIDEPSISYADFNAKLKAGEVTFVEFFAPDGDVAYATLKPAADGEAPIRIRIGEGYPIEQHNGFSSPAFCIRTVKNQGVPYKFIIPALAKINKN